MDKPTINQFQPDYEVKPGEVLALELEARGMTQKELSLRTGLTPKHLISIAKGESAFRAGVGYACSVLAEFGDVVSRDACAFE
jgi:transcriptional regulator with XRE-family HTH domain